MHPTPNNPCIFKGSPDGKNELYLGLYVDDFIYFSPSRETEIAFEQKLHSLTSVDFMGEVSHFIGIKFSWDRKPDNHIAVHMTQEAFADNLIDVAGLTNANTVKTPYRSGHPVDNIPSTQHPSMVQPLIKHTMQSLVGSLVWFSGATRPDLATIVSPLSQHTHHPTQGHINAVKYAIRYLKGTKNRGISFSSAQNDPMSAFLKFPVNPSKILPLCDANWGGQDQSIPDVNNPPELLSFVTRSMSGFIIIQNGPIHWVSKRQKVTARSSAEAEIYATDECVKELLRLQHIICDMGTQSIYVPHKEPIQVYNDNNACVCWSKSTTTKGLRHMTIRENAIRESVSDKTVSIKHIEGRINIADIFTKELKDIQLFITLRNLITSIAPNSSTLNDSSEERRILSKLHTYSSIATNKVK